VAKFEYTDESVVVVIGSGAGGGTLANELCQKGIKVVLLEAGARQSTASFINDEWKSFSQLAWLDARTTSGSWRVAKDFAGLPAWICKTVGGSTTHWAGASLRFQEHEFRARTTYGQIDGTNLLDWPVTLQELEPYYAKAENKMGVTRTNGIPGLPGNNNFKVLHAGAKKLGYKEVNTGRMAINSQPRDGRGRCMQLGFCFQGCKSGAKWSTLYTEIPKAEATGNLDLRTQAHVTRIDHDNSGKVTAVTYMDGAGKEQRQSARLVCVAGNSIETPRLLLMSASDMFKDGLANSSGQVGRNYMRHMTGSVYAAFKDPVHMYRGTTMAGIIQDEAAHNPKRGFAGGYEMETLALGIPFMAAFLNPGGWGADFAWWMEHYVQTAGMWLVGEDMPRETNRVTLNTSRTRTGTGLRSSNPPCSSNWDKSRSFKRYKPFELLRERSGVVARIELLNFTQHGGPHKRGAESSSLNLHGLGSAGDDVRVHRVKLAPRLSRNLNLASALEDVHPQEGFCDGTAYGQ
jgi:choline dehydrogenase-like flavoprotein